MRQAAGDMQLSLVMPNLFDHGAAERQYGDLIRIDNDASFGTWYILSEGPQTWQPIWSQWNNPFLGFTGFSDISGAGQVILDGDPVAISSFGNDGERETAISLFTMAGAALAITDQINTIGENARFFQNQEILAVHQAGLVGKPIYHSTHPFSVDPTSRDPERWIGQLPDGSWVVGLFNRSDDPATKSIDFASELGLSGPAPARDLWAHQDLGTMAAWTVALAPHACSLVKVTPTGPATYQAEVGAWTGTARFENTTPGYTGLGLRHRARYPRGRGHGDGLGEDSRPAHTGLPRGQRHRFGLVPHGDRLGSRRRAPAGNGDPHSSERRRLDHLADGECRHRPGYGRHHGHSVPDCSRPGQRQRRPVHPGVRTQLTLA